MNEIDAGGVVRRTHSEERTYGITTIVQLLMDRDGLVDTEAREVAQEVYARVVAGEKVNDVLPDYGIDPRELGLWPVNFGL